MDPAAAKILAYYPLPNLPGGTNNYVLSGPGQSRGDQGDIRLDHALTANDRLMLRYSVNDTANTPSPTFDTLGNSANYPSTGRQQNGVLSHIRTLGASAVNELRLGFNRIESATSAPTEGMDFPAQLGIPQRPARRLPTRQHHRPHLHRHGP
jgi:hypothetical protein